MILSPREQVLHLRRLNAEPTPVFTADRQQEEEERDKRRRIVVLGAGWGAHALMKVRSVAARAQARLILA